MKATVAVLADYTNLTREGKLNILGIFDEIRTPTVPIQHSEMKLVLRLELALAELDREHSIEVLCQDADGRDLVKLAGSFSARRPPGSTATSFKVNHDLGFRNLIFPAFGIYTFTVLVDHHIEAQVPLHILKSGAEQPTLPGT